MNVHILEKPVNKSSFTFNVELKELNVSGIVNFYSNNNSDNFQSFWNGKKITIPVYGVYKVSWGFYQNSIQTFYKDSVAELGLIIKEKTQDEKAKITKETPSFHALKSSHKSFTFLFREGETISLEANFLNTQNPHMKNIYLKVEKLNMDENNKFGYEN